MIKKSGGTISPKALIFIFAAAALVMAAWFVFLKKDPLKDASADAKTYIEAVRKKDFDAIFKYNGSLQRRRMIIERTDGGTNEKGLKEFYDERKKSFEDAVFVNDVGAQWSEKFLFIPGAGISFLGVETVIDRENPSQPATERINVVVKVKAGYPKKDAAPDLNGKIKSVVYKITMVHSRNVSRIMRSGVKESRWLFRSVSIEDGSIQYWSE